VQLHAGEANTLVVDDLSSISEDKVEQEILLGHLQRWAIRVICMGDPDLSAGDPERQLLRDFGSRSAFTKRIEGLRLEGQRVAAGKRSGKRREGAKRYGERPGEDRVLDQMKAFVQDGLGPTEISRRLNEMNVKPRRGKEWHPTTVANILGARREIAARKARKTAKQVK
jgi:Recombinase